MASPTDPLPERERTHHLLRLYQALYALEAQRCPDVQDWRMLSEMVFMLETWVRLGTCADANRVLDEAVAALAASAHRHQHQSQPLLLTPQEATAIRLALDSYAELIEALPARAVHLCHQQTIRRIFAAAK